MSSGNGESWTPREQAIRRVRSGIRTAQLRVSLDEVRGRQTPDAGTRLAQTTPPPLPSPMDALRSPEGRLRTDPASREEVDGIVRRAIWAANLRVALDEQRGRATPSAVKRLAHNKFPALM